MLLRSVLVVAFTLALCAPAVAAPRDEALRVAPTNAALVVVVQNLRDHAKNISESPFAAWFPTSALGKQLLTSDALKKALDGATPIFSALGITPADLVQDLIGDAVVFAYTPAPLNDPKGERAVIIVRPGKPETLAKVVDRLNDIQTKSGELKAITKREHAGGTYFERQKPDGPSDFYCFAGSVFAFSSSEADIKAVLERDKNAAKDKPPELVARMTKLGVADAAAVVLINPRPLDAELKAKVAAAKPDEKLFLTKFAEVWAALDSAALYFALGTNAELGVSLSFQPEKLPPALKGWLSGERAPSALWQSIPDNAMLAVAGRVKANDLIDFLASVVPTEKDKPGVRETIEQTLGPIVGKDKLPLVLDALGPDWGIWITAPEKGATVPVLVGAVRVQGEGQKGEDAAKALVGAIDYGFQTARIAYNATHKDQIELREEKDGDVVIKWLSGEAFPPGFRPCFALKNGYLLVSTSPEAIKSFRAPAAEPKAGGEVPLVRFNAVATRDYLTTHAPKLAKLLAGVGAGEEKTLLEQIGGLAAILEPVDKVELLTSGNATGLKVMLRVKIVKPLKK
ncbi:MAG: hypothetical protein L0241_11925 [Planctomycetia bacterium]|nr:hypothetical protein [Planctomycetia bacterium]